MALLDVKEGEGHQARVEGLAETGAGTWGLCDAVSVEDRKRAMNARHRAGQ